MRRTKKLLIMIMITVMLICNSLTVFAAADATTCQQYVTANGLAGLTEGTHYKLSNPGGLVEVSLDTYSVWITVDGQNRIEELIAAQTQQQQTSQQAQADVTAQLGQIGNVQPDMGRAQTTLSGFMPAISYVLGLLVTLITVGVTILCACDIAYITFPVIRGKCEEMKQNGGMGVDKKRSEKAGQARLKFISDEAEYAINAAETTQTGKNPLLIYFGKRCVAYIVLAIVIFILLTGNMTILIDIALKAVSGILDIIQEMAA